MAPQGWGRSGRVGEQWWKEVGGAVRIGVGDEGSGIGEDRGHQSMGGMVDFCVLGGEGDLRVREVLTFPLWETEWTGVGHLPTGVGNLSTDVGPLPTRCWPTRCRPSPHRCRPSPHQVSAHSPPLSAHSPPMLAHSPPMSNHSPPGVASKHLSEYQGRFLGRFSR